MLYTRRIFIWFLVAAAPTALAHGHGASIIVDDLGGTLTVSNGIVASNGFASMIFADGSSEAQLEHGSVPGFGPAAFTDQPGFIIQSLTPHSALLLEFIPRPVQGTNPVQERLLWHWSAATQTVGVAPNDQALAVVAELEQTIIRQPGSPVPPPLFAVHLPPENIGQHVHYLRYILDDNPSAATGAYGFFARLIGPPYEPSEPLLIVLNNGLDENTLRTAALAINAAAADGVALTGDYNLNGTVDAADFALWKNTLSSVTDLAADGSGNKVVDAADYGVWRANFGRTSTGAGSGVLAAGLPNMAHAGEVPEPRAIALAAWAMLAAIGGAIFKRANNFGHIPTLGEISIDSSRTSP